VQNRNDCFPDKEDTYVCLSAYMCKITPEVAAGLDQIVGVDQLFDY